MTAVPVSTLCPGPMRSVERNSGRQWSKAAKLMWIKAIALKLLVVTSGVICLTGDVARELSEVLAGAEEEVLPEHDTASEPVS